MYTNCYYSYDRNKIYIFDDEKGLLEDNYKPYCWRKTDNETEYRTIFGIPVEKHVVTQIARDNKNGEYYEIDISPELRVLVDNYYDKDEIPKNRIMILDIEVSSVGGFANQETANKNITSIAVKLLPENKSYSFVLDKTGRFTLKSTDTIKYFTFKTEKDLLKGFMAFYVKFAKPTIITGWNLFAFDIPYLYRRLCKVFSKTFANNLSPIGIVDESEINFSLKQELYKGYKIAGVSQLDYMILYKKYSINDRPMYNLEFISNEELKKGKIKYDGSLDDLYSNDLNKYVEYNLMDTELIKELEDKLHYIEIAIGMCHKGCITYDSVFHQSKIIEGAFLVYFKHNKIIAINKSENERDKFPGAYVKEPQQGRHKWVYSCDLTSLYPSIIRTLNISPETKFGKILNINPISHDVTIETTKGDTIEVSESKFEEFLKTKNIRKSSSGVLYRSDKKGFIPIIIEKWFNERKEYKKLNKDAKDNGDVETAKQYDIKQYVTKILLNSVYGVLGLSSFRFYDRDNALSVTSTGQQIIKYSGDIINKAYTILGAEAEKDYMIYGDTDSVYVSASPLIEGKTISNNNMFYLTRVVANVMTDLLNSELEKFTIDVLNSKEGYLSFNQEAICYSALWSKKKKYALYILEKEKFVKTKDGKVHPSGFRMPSGAEITNLRELKQWIASDTFNVDDMGIPINEIKYDLKVKGLDTVKSDFPIYFKEILKDVLIDVLEFKDKTDIHDKIVNFRNDIDSQDIFDIAIPKSVRNIEKYSGESATTPEKNSNIFVGDVSHKKGAPIHVKSAINYNKFLEKYKLLGTYKKILSGEKIKFIHLRKNEFDFETIGFKDNVIPKELLTFIEKYIDRKSIFQSVLFNKLQNFWDILGWGELALTENKLERFF